MKFFYLFAILLLLGCGQEGGNAEAFEQGRRLANEADSLNRIGQEKESRHRYNEAIAAFEQAGKAEGTTTALAFCHYQLDNFNAAAEHYETALARNPENNLAKLYLGLSFINQDQIEVGRAYVDAALAAEANLKPRTITELIRIGQASFEHGERKGSDEYRRFGIGVLLVAWEYSPKNPMVTQLLDRFATKIGDERILDLLKSE